jgi:hypothetical protein
MNPIIGFPGGIIIGGIPITRIKEIKNFHLLAQYSLGFYLPRGGGIGNLGGNAPGCILPDLNAAAVGF